ncbi:transcriptional regulator [Rugamonas rubra]|uniref:transcriptional regulator n=1 Tax=Rugamonas rubra TaxID=758825 RepID=UPI000B85C535|nr:Cro/CI family transcriptional regulator [Rugamonas rubra]
MNGIDKTIKHFGSLSAVARALGLSGYQVVQQWVSAKRVPAEHCTRIEELTSGAIRCEELNDRVNWSVVRNSTEPTTKATP